MHSQSMGVQGTLRWRHLVLVLLLAWSPQAAAVTPAEVQRQADRIIQQEQLRQDQILKDQDLRRRPPETLDLGIEKEEPTEDESKQCFEIEHIELEGAHSLSGVERQELIAPFIGKCIGLVEIRELLRIITNYYIDKGYITTRVYIPQQDLGSGTLKLLVVEGITERI